MKIKAKDLSAAVKQISPIFRGKASLPCLACVRLESAEGLLSLVATNLQEWQCEKISCEKPFAPICVNFAHFASSVGFGEETELEIDETDLRMSSGDSVRKLRLFPAEEYPAPKDSEGFKPIATSTTDLIAAMDAVHGFEHPDAVRGALCGIHIVGGPKSLMAEASNGSNIAQFSRGVISEGFEVIIPSASVAPVMGALERRESVFKVSDAAVRVEHFDGWYSCQMAEGLFPNTTPFLGRKFAEVGTVETVPLIQNLESLAPLIDAASIGNLSVDVTKTAINFLLNSTNSEAKFKTSGKFKPAEKFNVKAGAFLKCLQQTKSDTCEILAGDDCCVFKAEDLTIISMNLRMS